MTTFVELDSRHQRIAISAPTANQCGGKTCSFPLEASHKQATDSSQQCQMQDAGLFCPFCAGTSRGVFTHQTKRVTVAPCKKHERKLQKPDLSALADLGRGITGMTDISIKNTAETKQNSPCETSQKDDRQIMENCVTDELKEAEHMISKRAISQPTQAGSSAASKPADTLVLDSSRDGTGCFHYSSENVGFGYEAIALSDSLTLSTRAIEDSFERLYDELVRGDESDIRSESDGREFIRKHDGFTKSEEYSKTSPLQKHAPSVTKRSGSDGSIQLLPETENREAKAVKRKRSSRKATDTGGDKNSRNKHSKPVNEGHELQRQLSRRSTSPEDLMEEILDNMPDSSDTYSADATLGRVFSLTTERSHYSGVLKSKQDYHLGMENDEQDERGEFFEFLQNMPDGHGRSAAGEGLANPTIHSDVFEYTVIHSVGMVARTNDTLNDRSVLLEIYPCTDHPAEIKQGATLPAQPLSNTKVSSTASATTSGRSSDSYPSEAHNVSFGDESVFVSMQNTLSDTFEDNFESIIENEPTDTEETKTEWTSDYESEGYPSIIKYDTDSTRQEEHLWKTGNRRDPTSSVEAVLDDKSSRTYSAFSDNDPPDKLFHCGSEKSFHVDSMSSSRVSLGSGSTAEIYVPVLEYFPFEQYLAQYTQMTENSMCKHEHPDTGKQPDRISGEELQHVLPSPPGDESRLAGEDEVYVDHQRHISQHSDAHAPKHAACMATDVNKDETKSDTAQASSFLQDQANSMIMENIAEAGACTTRHEITTRKENLAIMRATEEMQEQTFIGQSQERMNLQPMDMESKVENDACPIGGDISINPETSGTCHYVSTIPVENAELRDRLETKDVDTHMAQSVHAATAGGTSSNIVLRRPQPEVLSQDVMIDTTVHKEGVNKDLVSCVRRSCSTCDELTTTNDQVTQESVTTQEVTVILRYPKKKKKRTPLQQGDRPQPFKSFRMHRVFRADNTKLTVIQGPFLKTHQPPLRAVEYEENYRGQLTDGTEETRDKKPITATIDVQVTSTRYVSDSVKPTSVRQVTESDVSATITKDILNILRGANYKSNHLGLPPPPAELKLQTRLKPAAKLYIDTMVDITLQDVLKDMFGGSSGYKRGKPASDMRPTSTNSGVNHKLPRSEDVNNLPQRSASAGESKEQFSRASKQQELKIEPLTSFSVDNCQSTNKDIAEQRINRDVSNGLNPIGDVRKNVDKNHNKRYSDTDIDLQMKLEKTEEELNDLAIYDRRYRSLQELSNRKVKARSKKLSLSETLLQNLENQIRNASSQDELMTVINNCAFQIERSYMSIDDDQDFDKEVVTKKTPSMPWGLKTVLQPIHEYLPSSREDKSDTTGDESGNDETVLSGEGAILQEHGESSDKLCADESKLCGDDYAACKQDALSNPHANYGYIDVYSPNNITNDSPTKTNHALNVAHTHELHHGNATTNEPANSRTVHVRALTLSPTTFRQEAEPQVAVCEPLFVEKCLHQNTAADDDCVSEEETVQLRIDSPTACIDLSGERATTGIAVMKTQLSPSVLPWYVPFKEDTTSQQFTTVDCSHEQSANLDCTTIRECVAEKPVHATSDTKNTELLDIINGSNYRHVDGLAQEKPNTAHDELSAEVDGIRLQDEKSDETLPCISDSVPQVTPDEAVQLKDVLSKLDRHNSLAECGEWLIPQYVQLFSRPLTPVCTALDEIDWYALDLSDRIVTQAFETLAYLSKVNQLDILMEGFSDCSVKMDSSTREHTSKKAILNPTALSAGCMSTLHQQLCKMSEESATDKNHSGRSVVDNTAQCSAWLLKREISEREPAVSTQRPYLGSTSDTMKSSSHGSSMFSSLTNSCTSTDDDTSVDSIWLLPNKHADMASSYTQSNSSPDPGLSTPHSHRSFRCFGSIGSSISDCGARTRGEHKISISDPQLAWGTTRGEPSQWEKTQSASGFTRGQALSLDPEGRASISRMDESSSSWEQCVCDKSSGSGALPPTVMSPSLGDCTSVACGSTSPRNKLIVEPCIQTIHYFKLEVPISKVDQSRGHLSMHSHGLTPEEVTSPAQCSTHQVQASRGCKCARREPQLEMSAYVCVSDDEYGGSPSELDSSKEINVEESRVCMSTDSEIEGLQYKSFIPDYEIDEGLTPRYVDGTISQQSVRGISDTATGCTPDGVYHVDFDDTGGTVPVPIIDIAGKFPFDPNNLGGSFDLRKGQNGGLENRHEHCSSDDFSRSRNHPVMRPQTLRKAATAENVSKTKTVFEMFPGSKQSTPCSFSPTSSSAFNIRDDSYAKQSCLYLQKKAQLASMAPDSPMAGHNDGSPDEKFNILCRKIASARELLEHTSPRRTSVDTAAVKHAFQQRFNEEDESGFQSAPNRGKLIKSLSTELLGTRSYGLSTSTNRAVNHSHDSNEPTPTPCDSNAKDQLSVGTEFTTPPPFARSTTRMYTDRFSSNDDVNICSQSNPDLNLGNFIKKRHVIDILPPFADIPTRAGPYLRRSLSDVRAAKRNLTLKLAGEPQHKSQTSQESSTVSPEKPPQAPRKYPWKR